MTDKEQRPLKVNWDEAKAYYVQGEISETGEHTLPTLKDVAEKFGRDLGTVKNRSHQEGWTRQRDLFMTKVAKDRENAVKSRIAGHGAQFDENNITLATALQGEVAKALKEVTDSNKTLSGREIKELASALTEVQKVGRLALGESTNNNRNTFELDPESLRNLSDEQLTQYEQLLTALTGTPRQDTDSDQARTSPTTH